MNVVIEDDPLLVAYEEYVLDPDLLSLVRARPSNQRTTYPKIGFYGDTGVGKTFMWGTIVECIPAYVKQPLYVEIEGGGLTIANRGIDTVTVTTWKEFNEVFDELYMMVYSPKQWWEWVQKRLKEGKKVWIAKRYDWICFDSLTELDKIIMKDIMIQVVKEDSKRDPLVPAPRDWGKGSERVRDVVRETRNMPIGCVYIFLEFEREDAITKEAKIRPNVHGRLAGEIPGFLDVLGHLSVSSRIMRVKGADGKERSVEVRERLMRFQPSGRFIAKDRSQRLGDTMKDPSMKKILDAIFEGDFVSVQEEAINEVPDEGSDDPSLVDPAEAV